MGTDMHPVDRKSCYAFSRSMTQKGGRRRSSDFDLPKRTVFACAAFALKLFCSPNSRSAHPTASITNYRLERILGQLSAAYATIQVGSVVYELGPVCRSLANTPANMTALQSGHPLEVEQEYDQK